MLGKKCLNAYSQPYEVSTYYVKFVGIYTVESCLKRHAVRRSIRQRSPLNPQVVGSGGSRRIPRQSTLRPQRWKRQEQLWRIISRQILNSLRFCPKCALPCRSFVYLPR